MNPLFQLPEPLARTLEGFGGPLASWFLYAPARALLDVGEGITSRLVQRITLPEVIFLSHAHYDHISGLTGLLLARTMMRGDTHKPLTIYFPAEAEEQFQMLRGTVNAYLQNPTYPLTWCGVVAGERLRTRSLLVEPFATLHDVPSLGYRFLQKRSKLKEAYRDCNPQQLRELKGQGVAIQDEIDHVVLAFTGDTGPGLDPALFHHADVLIHEATFLYSQDRRDPRHASVEETLHLAVEANVKTLVLYHLSPRYGRAEIAEVIETLRERTGFEGNLSVAAGFTHSHAFYE